MPDPIQGPNTTGPITPTASTVQTVVPTPTDATGTPEPTAPGADLADVAKTEALLQSIVQAANNAPGIDQTKVAELQQAIASGAYQVNPQSIAQQIAELETLLGTAGIVR